MFEDMTYEYILNRALSRVSNDVDKRQGSIIYDAIAPACAELAQAYIRMGLIMDNAFADTAIRKYLILRAKERGIEPYAATKAILKGVFNCEVPVGSRFNLGELNYVVLEKIKDYEYQLQCETEGGIGNAQFGRLLPLETIQGLETATLTEVLIPGRDEENTDDFRQRYFDTIDKDAFGGNKADYQNWVKAIDGVGQVKVQRTPSGGGTVGIIVMGADDEPASQKLLDDIKQQLDPTNGEGDGISPVGHNVTVKSASYIGIAVNVDWVLEDGSNEHLVNTQAVKAIEEYFADVNSEWENNKKLRAYSAQVLVRLLDIDGVVNITDVKLNGGDYVETEFNQVFMFDTLNE